QVVLRVLLGGIVHQDVERAELLLGAAHRLEAKTLVGDVAGDQHAAAALGLDQTLGLLRVLVLVQIDDRHMRALAREVHGDRATDAAVAAGDQRDFIFELTAAAVIGPDENRPRLHIALASRLPRLPLRRALLLITCFHTGLISFVARHRDRGSARVISLALVVLFVVRLRNASVVPAHHDLRLDTAAPQPVPALRACGIANRGSLDFVPISTTQAFSRRSNFERDLAPKAGHFPSPIYGRTKTLPL